MMKTLFNKKISPIMIYRLVRWAFGLFFITVGFLYKDAWPAFIFGGIFIITSFFTPHQCVGNNCNIDQRS